MFKSKSDFKAFDKKNDKVKNLEPKAVKALSKNGVKKLAAQEGEKTPFHLIVDYFTDDKGKPQGHFFDLGLNKALTKHFEQVEMKSGKMDKSMSDSPKKASAGLVYVKKVNGEKIVHIEPSENSKVPVGKWAKILKSLKSSFGGLKAVAVIGGQVIEEAIEDVKDVLTGEDSQDEKTDNASPKDGGDSSVVDKLKSLFVDLAADMKGSVKNVASNVKKKQVTKEDKDITNAILDKFRKLESTFGEAGDDVKGKVKANYDALIKYVPQIEKIQKAIDSLIGTEGNEGAVSELEKEMEALLKQLQGGIKTFDSNYSKTKKEIDNSKSEPIKGGQDLVDSLS